MKDPNFRELKTGTTKEGRPIRLVYRQVLMSKPVRYCHTVAAGNCILFNGTEEECNEFWNRVAAN